MRAVAVACAAALTLAACGSDSGGGGEVSGDTLAIYSSLPLTGVRAADARDVVDAAKLALAEARGRVGDFKVNFSALDDTGEDTGRWGPGEVAANARKAIQDRSTIAYIGELEGGASAVSVPILNEAGILQITPADTLTGLTRAAGGGDRGEPDKYYPNGKRTFGRVVAADHVQVDALLDAMEDQRVRTLAIVDDEQIYGRSIASVLEREAPGHGIRVVERTQLPPDDEDVENVVEDVVEDRPDAVFHASAVPEAGVRLLRAIHAAASRIRLFAPDALASGPFLVELGDAERVTTVTSAALPADRLPRASRAFARRFEARFGRDPRPVAAFGFEAMSVVLQAIADAGKDGNDREAVIDAFFAIENRRSLLGTYSVDPNGDTTLARYGIYRVRNGQLRLVAVREGAPPS